MGDTKALKFYISFLVVFGIIITYWGIETNNFDLTKYTIFLNMYGSLNNSGGLLTVLSYFFIPFIILDTLLILLAMMAFSFTVIPPILSTIILSPLVIFVIIDYIIPTVRGN